LPSMCLPEAPLVFSSGALYVIHVKSLLGADVVGRLMFYSCPFRHAKLISPTVSIHTVSRISSVASFVGL